LIQVAAYALFAAFAVWQLCLGIFASRVISYHAKPVSRADDPLTFWATLAVWIAILCLSASALFGPALHALRISN
jgi:hypothetical protein